MPLKLAKISVSNINQVLSSLKTYQALLYFSKLPGITYISISYRKGFYSMDLDIMNIFALCLLNFSVRN